MNAYFFQKFSEVVDINENEKNHIGSHLMQKKIRKRQYLLQEGDVCRYITFVEKGALRSFTVDEKGSEHIIQFAIEGWLISDLYSFLTIEPSVYNIEAIENSELVMISKQSHDELLKSSPKYETFIRVQLTDAYISMQRRLTSVISLPLEERYANFTSLYPEIVQRVPQHMIASFMGLTPETLSRVRRRIRNK